MPKMSQFTDKFPRLYKAMHKGNVSDIKSFLKDVPAEALFLIKGFQVPGYEITPFKKCTDAV